MLNTQFKTRLPFWLSRSLIQLPASVTVNTGLQAYSTQQSLPAEATLVILSGEGCTGPSIAYHLAERGMKNVVLLEKVPQGTAKARSTPGFVSSFHRNPRYRRLCTDSLDMYNKLASGGKSFHFNPVGSLRLASTPDRVAELYYHHSRDWLHDKQFQILSPAEIRHKCGQINTDKVQAALYTERDGYLNEAELKQTLLDACQSLGVQINDNASVLGMKITADTAGRWEISTTAGTIMTRHVVNAGGVWAKDLAKLVGMNLPLTHLVHTFGQGSVSGETTPAIYDLENRAAYRREGNAVVFSPIPLAKDVRALDDWSQQGVPSDFQGQALSGEAEVLKIPAQSSSSVYPPLKNVEFEAFIEPLSMTADGYPLLGPAYGLKNYWLAAGFLNEVQVAGAAGKFLADSIIDGEPPFELTFVEPNRFGAWATRTRGFARFKAIESYAMQYDNPVKPAERVAGRPSCRVSGIYGALIEAGAHMAFRAGWEQCDHFKTSKQETYRDVITRECGLVTRKCGVIDLSLYGKLEVRGTDAQAFADYLFASDAPKLGQMNIGFTLSPKGRLFSRMRVINHQGGARDEVFLMVVRPEQEQRDFQWLDKVAHERNFKVQINNVTEYLGCIGVMGPKSRDILSSLTRDNLSNQQFPYQSARLIRLAGIPVIACRDTTTGELGWQLYHGRADSLKVYEAIMQAGKRDIGNFGRWAFNALRIEKGHKFWGHELSLDHNPFEAGIEHLLNANKDFVGLAGFKELSKQPLRKKLVHLALENEDRKGKPLSTVPFGFEVVKIGDKVVGYVTSGCWSMSLQRPLCFAYIDAQLGQKELEEVDVEVGGRGVKAKVLDKPPVLPYHLREEGEAEKQQEKATK